MSARHLRDAFNRVVSGALRADQAGAAVAVGVAIFSRSVFATSDFPAAKVGAPKEQRIKLWHGFQTRSNSSVEPQSRMKHWREVRTRSNPSVEITSKLWRGVLTLSRVPGQTSTEGTSYRLVGRWPNNGDGTYLTDAFTSFPRVSPALRASVTIATFLGAAALVS